MGPIKTPMKRWDGVGTRLTVVIVLQALGLAAGWPQEPAPPRIDQEITKQEEIFRRRGADVPRGYITTRGLSDYAELLPSGCRLTPLPERIKSMFEN